MKWLWGDVTFAGVARVIHPEAPFLAAEEINLLEERGTADQIRSFGGWGDPEGLEDGRGHEEMAVVARVDVVG
jgi:hypothetical protein